MNSDESQAPILLGKKLGSLFLLLVGFLLLGMGYNYRSTSAMVLGGVALAGGAVLLAIKIRRRNEGA
jgi:hypothetical protein